MTPAPDYYALLGVFRDATQEEIKQAYFEAARRLHPDKNQAPGETELFLDIQQAYEVLSDPSRRAKYDATLPDPDEKDSPIVSRILYSRKTLVKINEPQLVYALLEWKPRQLEKEVVSPPLNICLVLDRSTSMQGESMDMLKAATIHLLNNLRQKDILGIVAFSDRAEVVVPASIYLDKRRTESQIRMMMPSGATEIYQGLKAGVNEVRRNFSPERINHIILLTDGHTYGDEDACLRLAEDVAKEGISISGIGLGDEWNDSFLDTLASKTGGSSMLITHPKDIQTMLERRFSQLSKVFAENNRLEFEIPEGVILKYAFRLHPNTMPLPPQSPMALGNILRDMPLSILLEFEVHPEALKGNVATLLRGAFHAHIPTQATPPPPRRVRVVRPVTKEATPEPPPHVMIQALANLNLYRMQEQAQEDAKQGRYESASRRLEHLATNLLSQGNPSLARTVILEAQHLKKMQTFTEKGRKHIKYGTRALLLPGEKEENL
jgi:Ca-activated chloride channel family protein